MLVVLLLLASSSALQLRPAPAVATPRLVRATVSCCDQALPSPPVLSGTQRRALRAHAGRLAQAKMLNYVSVAVVERSQKEVDVQLTAVELVRCKFAVTKKAEAKEMAAELGKITGAAVAEVIGHTALLYRPGPQRLIKLDELTRSI